MSRSPPSPVARVGSTITSIVLQPNSSEAVGALIWIRLGVLALALALLVVVGRLWTDVRGPYVVLSSAIAAWLLAVTGALALLRRVRSARTRELVVLASFLSDILMELLLLGAADTTRSAFLLFPLLTVISAALIGGTRTALICLGVLSVGYPIAVMLGIRGHLEALAPPYERIESLPQVLYHTVSQISLVAIALALYVYVVTRLRSLAQVYDDELQRARRQIEADTRRRAEDQHLVQMGRMTSYVAHELRNPLTAILTSAELIEMDIDDHALIRESTTDIKAQTLRLARMLGDVLDYTREFQPEARNHDLFPIVEDLLDGLDTVADVGWDGPLTLPVFVDPDHIQQVLHNLLRNAAQAAGAGGRVRVVGQRLGDEQVVLEVHDDGPGVPEADRERVFEAFYTTKPKGEGTGLGLAICRRLCQLNGMTLAVGRSDLGGALFRLQIPAALAGRPVEPPTRPSLEESFRPGTGDGAQPLVLVVEDEQRLRANVARTVARAGYRVRAASTLAEAREALREAVPRVVLLDLALGDEDGAELMADLPAGPDRPAVLVTSAYSDRERRERLRALGAADYLVKPVRRKVLLGAIRDQLAR